MFLLHIYNWGKSFLRSWDWFSVLCIFCTSVFFWGLTAQPSSEWWLLVSHPGVRERLHPDHRARLWQPQSSLFVCSSLSPAPNNHHTHSSFVERWLCGGKSLISATPHLILTEEPSPVRGNCQMSQIPRYSVYSLNAAEIRKHMTIHLAIFPHFKNLCNEEGS